jgi:hypothetical protein
VGNNPAEIVRAVIDGISAFPGPGQ